MKRIILVAAVLVVSATIAQPVDNPVRPTGVTRIAVINVGVVFYRYEKALRFKKEIDAMVLPARQEALRLTAEMKEIAAAIARGDFGDASKEEYEEKLTDTKRQLEDLDKKTRKQLSKTQEENLMVLWKDVQEAVQIYAVKNGIQLVLGYGDPMKKNEAEGLPNWQRKMQAMDSGGVVPLFMESRAEIAEAVVDLLNSRYREEKRKASE